MSTPMTSPSLSTSWIAKGLDLADFYGTRCSKDPSTKVGAMLMNRKKRPVGWGYNGFPDRLPDDPARLADREAKNADTIHAEVNAVLNAIGSPEDTILFVNYPPCGDCAKFIIQAGIAEVHYIALDPEDSFAARWACSMERAADVFARARVPVFGWRRGFTADDLLPA